jgi:hypothetical protein
LSILPLKLLEMTPMEVMETLMEELIEETEMEMETVMETMNKKTM